MLLSEKIAFLCHLTDTSNKKLATALSVDPSLISRIKSGRRNLPRNSAHLALMGNYFAQKCTSDYQRKALSETIGQARIKLVMKKELLSEIITQWLSDTSPTSFQNVQHIINEQGVQDHSGVVPDQVEDIDFGERINCYIYYGNHGKRLALRNMVLYLLKYGTPCTVLVSSDESLEWLMECNAFLESQQTDLVKLTEAGYYFNRIAPKYADIEETVAAFSRWIPVYMRSKCETYYYPRIRDNVYHRTLVVAPGQIALCSASVGNHIDSGLTFLYTDPYVANNLASEFHDLHRQCVPLAVSYTHSNTSKTILDCITQHIAPPGNLLTKFYGLPSLVAPPDLIKRIYGNDKKSIDTFTMLALQCQRRLRENNVIDIITLDTPRNIRDGKALCTVSRLVPDVPECYYSIREYIEHLQIVLKLMDENPDYTVILHEDLSDVRSTICTVDTGKCFIVRINEPVTLFEISDPKIGASAKEYILNLIRFGSVNLSLQRKETIEEIKALISTLETMENPEAEIPLGQQQTRKGREKPHMDTPS